MTAIPDHPPFCPSCGFNLKADQTVTRGDWRITAQGVVYYRGKRVKLAASEGEMLHTMATSTRPVSRPVLYARIGSCADDHEKVIQVRISNLRRILLDARIPLPFETVNKRGYLWIAE